MKKFKKAIIALSVCAVAALGAAGLAACGDNEEETTAVSGTAQGEYFYENYGTTYGVKVSITVEDGVITSVTRVNSDYVEATTGYDGAWETAYNDGIDELLETYVGKTVEYVLSIEVATSDSGEPLAQSSDGFVSYGDENEFLIADATQSAGRLLLAVQDALNNL